MIDGLIQARSEDAMLEVSRVDVMLDVIKFVLHVLECNPEEMTGERMNEWKDIYCKWKKTKNAINQIQKGDMDLIQGTTNPFLLGERDLGSTYL